MDVLSGSRPKLHFSPLTGKARLDTRSCRIACELSSSNPSPKISPPPESFSELKQRIALIRELPFKREVSLANESPQATSEGILSDEYGTQSLVHISRAYDSDFFVNPQISLQLADYVRLERTFYYEARKDLIVISPSRGKVLRQTRKSVAHPPFRLGTANERNRGRRSNIG